MVGSLKEFLAEYGNMLLTNVSRSQPLYSPDAEGAFEAAMRERLTKLLRTPFPKQAEAVLALTKGFKVRKHRGLFLTAEMGTGKTMMAISTSFLLCPPKSRTLIMCPGHLVQKWIREIKETIPDAHVVNLNRSGLGMLLELKSTKPTQREYYVLGKEQAKLHYARTSGAASFQHRDHITWTCPRCGSTLDSEPNVRSRRVRCERCKEPLWQADGNRFRRYSKAEYVKRHFPRGKAFNLFIADEVHQYKAGDTAQGQAFAIFCNAAKHTLCLTGTLMGGYSSGLFYLLWRTSPRTMSQIVDYHSIKAFSERYGVTEQVIKTSDKDGRASIGRSSRVTVRERPGISPQILTDLLLERSVFMRLEDVADNLPPFSEYVETVELPSDLAGEYGKFKDALEGEVKRALARGDRSLLGAMLQALLAYPDGARRGEKVLHPTTDDLIAEAPEIPCDVLPKEQRLIEIVQREKEAGRKVLVCLEHTGTRDLIPDLVERLEAAGLKTAALRATTTTPEKREGWIKNVLAKRNVDVLLTNPRLVETGLDLIEFPTIVFFQPGYSTFTLRQASRRSWRIGQSEPVRVVYLVYSDTLQELALKLMANKMQVALLVEGELSDKGLTALADGEASILVQMAKAVLGEDDDAVDQSLDQVWESLQATSKHVLEHLNTAHDTARTGKKSCNVVARPKQRTRRPQRTALGVLRKARGVYRGKLLGHTVSVRNGALLAHDGVAVGQIRQAVGVFRWVGDLFGKPIEVVPDGNRSFLVFELDEDIDCAA